MPKEIKDHPTQVRFGRTERRGLEALARIREESISEVIRKAVESEVREAGGPLDAVAKRRVIAETIAEDSAETVIPAVQELVKRIEALEEARSAGRDG